MHPLSLSSHLHIVYTCRVVVLNPKSHKFSNIYHCTLSIKLVAKTSTKDKVNQVNKNVHDYDLYANI